MGSFQMVSVFAVCLIATQNVWAFQGHNGGWVNAWTSMPQLTESASLPPAPFNGSSSVFFNSTIRQTFHMSIGGDEIRVRFSNAFGVNDLQITAATVALPVGGVSGASEIIPTTLKTLTFSGSESFIVPNGALVVSDPIAFPIESQQTITVTVYLAQGQDGFFHHLAPWQSRNNLDFVRLAHWYFVSAVETFSATASAFVVLGDSLTDGDGSDTDKNNRWPDLLLARMQKDSATSQISVNNQAAAGNRLLADRHLGANVLSRIDRDVLSQSGVKYVMIFEGVNDIGLEAATTEVQTMIGDRLIAAFKQIVTRVHAAGIPIFAATITPFNAPANTTIQTNSSPVREVTRQRVNAFIRTSGIFDAVIDFDKVVADPAIPSQLSPTFNSGDFLHPSVAGYTALAAAFPLDLFERFSEGVESIYEEPKPLPVSRHDYGTRYPVFKEPASLSVRAQPEVYAWIKFLGLFILFFAPALVVFWPVRFLMLQARSKVSDEPFFIHEDAQRLLRHRHNFATAAKMWGALPRRLAFQHSSSMPLEYFDCGTCLRLNQRPLVFGSPRLSSVENEVKVLIAAAEANIERLTVQIRELSLMRDRERSILASLRLMVVPIGKLPTELLAEIFKIAVHTPVFSPTYKAASLYSTLYGNKSGTALEKVLCLSQVSPYWRQIVLNTPQLWAEGVLDIDLVSLTRDDKSSLSKAVARIIIPSAQRWKNLHIDLPSFDHFNHLPPGTFEVVEHLFIEDFSKQTDVILGFHASPCLRNFTLRSRDSAPLIHLFHLPWSQLTHLDVKDVSLGSCRRVLLQCNNIVWARIDTSYEWDLNSGTRAVPVVVLPFLDRLILAFHKIPNSQQVHGMEAFLEVLGAPSLKTLNLKFDGNAIDPWPAEVFSQFQSRSPKIEEITLYFGSVDRSQLLALLRQSPDLTTLKLQHCWDCIDDHFWDALRYDDADNAPLVPKLQHIFMESIGSAFTEASFEAAIRSRWWKDDQHGSTPRVSRLKTVSVAHYDDGMGNFEDAFVAQMQDLVAEGLGLDLP
ncbi:Extracellular GDSL-like lipase/acylhydrolase [Mycena venus]|uniref:Extracellular GDSL-like lipase/acylhydrolase n=1 Tax=Mycena venus TaxID=2733690 RepID=A0A8H7D3N2_9AGAR|nr:Extracellular GDSL-like lipase/acylhydrolase [Mycena venus]